MGRPSLASPLRRVGRGLIDSAAALSLRNRPIRTEEQMAKLQSLRSAASSSGNNYSAFRRAWLRLAKPGIAAGGAVLLTASEANRIAKEAGKPRKTRGK
jgi:hypothetical protein